MNHKIYFAHTFRVISVFSVMLAAFALVSSTVFAAGFELLKIGQLSTAGARYSEWWYTVENPILSGTAAQNSSVTIKIDDSSFSVNSDASGAWSYSPTGLTNGDHKVDLSNSAGSYAFTLHVGQNLPENLGGTSSGTTGTPQTTSSQPATPVTGSNELAAIIMSALLFSFGVYLYNKKAIKSFEKDITKGL